MDDAARTHAWTTEPVEESLDGARTLTVSVVDRLMRDGWEQLARVAGIPARRWRRHHPVGAGPLVAIVDGRPAFDAAAWVRCASLVPGAVSMPTRTAAALGVGVAKLQPPGRRPWRLVDLVRVRRARARMRRAERRLEGDLELLRARLHMDLDAAMAAGDDGTPLAALPGYALAARLELLLAAGRGWTVAATIELANGDATARLLRLLQARGAAPGEALLQLARTTTSGTAPHPDHVRELERIAELAPADRDAALATWLDGLGGWHSMRELLLEAPPLRDDPAAVRSWIDRIGARRAPTPATGHPAASDRDVRDAIDRARRLVALRERASHQRADLHAALRAVTHALAEQLTRDGMLPRPDAAFDLEVDELLAAARGVEPSTALRAIPSTSTDQPAAASVAAPGGELRGIPASAGVAAGAVVVLDDPGLDAPVDGAVLVCRSTDPGWLPLMLRCAALVTERGGPLSHAAIVARELGLPAVVGVRGVVQAARDAATARVDGSVGTISFQRD